MFGRKQANPEVVSTDCIDLGSPFDATHLGKLPRIKESAAPPANHCVIELANGSYGVLRFRPLNNVGSQVSYGLENRSINPGNSAPYFESAERAAAVHAKHLQYLGEIGLNPWFTDVKIGTSTAFNGAPGVFVRQPLLPGHAIYPSLLPGHELRLSLMAGHSVLLMDRPWEKRIGHIEQIDDLFIDYAYWASKQPEGVFLTDIGAAAQYSVLASGKLTLHDIEPMYGPVKPYIEMVSERITNKSS